MVSGRRRRIYWNSCVWLSYINGYPDRRPTLDALLADSVSNVGDITLVTSTVSITEVAFALAEQQQAAPEQAIEAGIDAMWDDTRAITLIEFHPHIAREARGLIRRGLQHQWSLKPLDAIHLATAKWFEVVEFHTYDKKLKRYESELEFPVLEPHVSGFSPAAQTKLDFDEPQDT